MVIISISQVILQIEIITIFIRKMVQLFGTLVDNKKETWKFVQGLHLADVGMRIAATARRDVTGIERHEMKSQ